MIWMEHRNPKVSYETRKTNSRKRFQSPCFKFSRNKIFNRLNSSEKKNLNHTMSSEKGKEIFQTGVSTFEHPEWELVSILGPDGSDVFKGSKKLLREIAFCSQRRELDWFCSIGWRSRSLFFLLNLPVHWIASKLRLSFLTVHPRREITL